MSFGLFSLVVSALVSLASIYLYRRVFRDTAAPGWLRWLAMVGLTLLGPGFVVVRQLFWPLPFPYGGWVTAAQWSWAVVVGFLLAALGVGALVRKAIARREATPPSPERRLFLSRVTAGAAVAASGGFAGYGYWRAYGAIPSVREIHLKVARWPRALSGFTIAQLTDVHVGSIIQRRFIDEVVARTNGIGADLVAITGDLVDGSPAQIGHAVAGLGKLRSKFGTCFVTGNHEYHSDEAVWSEVLTGLGVQVLRNRSLRIGDAGGAFQLLGVDDWMGARRRKRQGYDLPRAMEGTSPDLARVLLAHQPANFVAAADAGVDLQLSGHTHGGQVFPMTGLIKLYWDHSAGLYAHGDSQLYVSRGTGFWGPPLRVGSPPEIVKLVITPA